MQVASRAPSPTLARFVRSIRASVRTESAPPYVRLPDGELELVVRVSASDASAHAIGTRTRPFHKLDSLAADAIAVRFAAGGAYPFFGVPISELTDSVVSLDTLWGREGARLRERLASARDREARVALVEAALVDRMRRDVLFEPASAQVARRAVRAIRDASEPVRIEELARQLDVSARQLRRVFTEVVGVGPKSFARIVRFQRALRVAERARELDWRAIAAATGYYDQSHLIADFRALAGITPGAFARDHAGGARLVW